MSTPEQPGPGRLYIAAAVLSFAVLGAGTSSGWLVPGIRLVAVVAMAILIALWLRGLLRGADRVDAAVALLLGAYAIAVAASIVPRLSLESLYAAVALAALFGTVRRLSTRNRTAVLGGMSVLGVVLVLTFLVLWAGTWIRWTQLTGLLPSLALRLPSAPFGHPHDVPLLLGLLVPALFVPRWRHRATVAKVGAVAIAVALVLVAGMSGGRGVWLAFIGATVVVVLSSAGAMEWMRRRWVAGVAAMGIGAAATVVSGLGSILVTRLTATASLDLRFEIWQGALSAAIQRPVLGNGPGTFPFVLQSTGYFDRVSFEPAHADSIFIQALTEIGVVGLLAGLVAVAAVGADWRRDRPPAAAVWALSFAVIAGITANPTALGYGAILIVVWAALATPFRRASWSGARFPRTFAVLVSVFGLALVTLATTAAVAFDMTRGEAMDRPQAALAKLDAAIALDPAFPLYRRERGSLLVAIGREDEAVRDLEAAASTNRWDDTTFRSLAISRLKAGNPDGALEAAQQALTLQRTDALNHATLAYVADAIGDETTRNEALTELIRLAPWAAADPAWETTFPQVPPANAVRWASEESPGSADLWPAVLTGEGAGADLSPAQLAFNQLVRCLPDEAMDALSSADQSAKRTGDYWLARVVLAELSGDDASAALETYIMLSSPVRREGSPFGAPLIDERAYGRLPLPHGGLDLPSQDDGIRAWVAEPNRAIARMRGDAGCEPG